MSYMVSPRGESDVIERTEMSEALVSAPAVPLFSGYESRCGLPRF